MFVHAALPAAAAVNRSYTILCDAAACIEQVVHGMVTKYHNTYWQYS